MQTFSPVGAYLLGKCFRSFELISWDTHPKNKELFKIGAPLPMSVFNGHTTKENREFYTSTP